MSTVMKFLFLLVGFSLAFSVTILPSVEQIRKTERTAQVTINGQTIIAEIANTPEERKRGLSGVKYLRSNEGMLFVFDKKDNHSFWMKGMRIPIDIIWISGEEIVGYESRIFPESYRESSELTVYKPPEPVDRVLEIRAGRFEMFDAEVGDKAEIKTLVPDQKLTGILGEAVKRLKVLKENKSIK